MEKTVKQSNKKAIKMKKKSISKKVAKISGGLVNRLVDLVLLGLIFFEEMAPYQQGSLGQKISRIDRRFGNLLEKDSLRGAFRTAQKKGWISQDLIITSQGQERLKAILPKYWEEKKWEGKWYIVAYDIPETKKWLREVLRAKLKTLGFGPLHKSLWVSPYNFLGDVEKIVKQYNLGSYVLLAISNKVGREPSEILAEMVWNLAKINEDYRKFVEEVRAKKTADREAIFQYLAILYKDPQLPSDLLPENWQGKAARQIYQKLVTKDKLQKILNLMKR